MRTREKLNLDYKAAKLAGTTNATSFKAYIAELEVAKNIATESIQEKVQEVLVVLTEKREEVVQEIKTNKVAFAKAIFEEVLNSGTQLVRKDIISRFINEVGLTKKGASTYYQNFKKAAGLVEN